MMKTLGRPVPQLQRSNDVAVPKRRMSRSNTRSRRAQWKTAAPVLVACPQCHELKLPHTACPACGTYNRRQVITPS
jgi:large subunit ribosomal protein L32